MGLGLLSFGDRGKRGSVSGVCGWDTFLVTGAFGRVAAGYADIVDGGWSAGIDGGWTTWFNSVFFFGI